MTSAVARTRSAGVERRWRTPSVKRRGAVGVTGGSQGVYHGGEASNSPRLLESVGTQRAPVRRLALNLPDQDSGPRRIRHTSDGKSPGAGSLAGACARSASSTLMINEWMCLIDTTPATAHLTRTTATNDQDHDTTAADSHNPGPVCPPGAQAVDGNGVPDHRVHDRASGNPPSDIVGRRRVVLLPHGPDRTDRSPVSPERPPAARRTS